MDDVSFGEWLKRQRSGRGLTQEQLAQQIGCAAITLRKIESEQRRPSAQIVQRLAEILNIPQTERATFLRFARGDPTKAPGEVVAEEPWNLPATTPKPRNNLPAQLTTFIGRETEIEAVSEALRDHRLVTLTGSGGTGKTRLSLEVAQASLMHFDYEWFVELAPISDPKNVPLTILSAMGVGEQQGRSPQDLICEYLQGKKTLIVLDNCEHLIDAIAKIAYLLLNEAPALRILASSREPLGVRGEMAWHVPPLALPDPNHLPPLDELAQYESIRLFCDRAALADPAFRMTNDNGSFVAQICARLDGIPLALELAAARIRALSVDQIAKRLDDCFRLLTGGSRTALERHQTLRATIDWSYNLLTAEAKTLVRSLSVFSGSWTLEAVESVCGQEGSGVDILDLLTQLVDKSLVISHASRYRMLETTRQYAAERLFDSEEGESVHDKHLNYFLELAEQADREIHGPHQLEWMDRVEAEHDNYRAALDWCVSNQKTAIALRLICALSWVWDLRSRSSEVQSWCNDIRALPDVTKYPALYARLLNWIGEQGRAAGDALQARPVLEEGCAIWLNLGVEGEQGLAEALSSLGNLALKDEQDMDTARSFFERSLELYHKHGDQRGVAWAMLDLGFLAVFQGRYAEGEELTMKSLAKFQEIKDKYSVAYALNSLGEVARLQVNYERAAKFYEQNMVIFRELRLRGSLVIPFLNLAWVSLDSGDSRKAKALFEESLKLSKESRDKLTTTLGLAGCASVLGMTGKPEQAARLFGAIESFGESISPMEPADQKEIDHYVAAVRAQLDQAAFAKAWAEGRTMTTEQAIAYALDA